MKRTIARLILVILAAGALTALICPQFAKRPLGAPRAQTLVEISQMYLCILHAERSNGVPILETLDKASCDRGTDYNQRLAEFLKERGVKMRYGFDRAGRSLLLDVWGDAFHVCRREFGIQRGLPANLLGDKSLIIWSSGPDRVDNCGQGDDVFWVDPNR